MPEEDQAARDYFVSICKSIMSEESFHSGLSSFIEFLRFDCKPINFLLCKDGFYQDLLKNYFNEQELNHDSVRVVYSLIRADKKLTQSLEQNNSVVTEWFAHINAKNAHALSSLVNELYNSKYSQTFISNETLQAVFEGLKSNDIAVAAKFSYLLERLGLYLHTETYLNFRESLLNFNLGFDSSEISLENLYFFSSIIRGLYCINQKPSEKILHKNCNIFSKLLNKDPYKAYQGMRPILDTCFHQISRVLGGFKLRNTLYKQAEIIIHGLDSKKIGQAINSMERRQSESFLYLLLFIDTYNKSKLKDIVSLINFEYFKMIFPEDTMDDDHERFFRLIFYTNQKLENVQEYFEYLRQKYNVYRSFFLLEEESTISLIIESRKSVNFSEIKLFGWLLAKLEKKGEIEHFKRIVEDNKKFIDSNLFSNSINVDNDKLKLNFYSHLFDNYNDFFIQLISQNDFNILLNKIERLAKGKKVEKQSAKLYLNIIEKAEPELSQKVNEFRKKYPKTLSE